MDLIEIEKGTHIEQLCLTLFHTNFIWLEMIKMPFLLLNNLNDINCGHVRKCVMRSIIFGQNIYKI